MSDIISRSPTMSNPSPSLTVSNPSPFLRLPIELRQIIYRLYFKAADRLDEGTYPGSGKITFEMALLQTNKQIHEEALAEFRRKNIFVKIGADRWTIQHIIKDWCFATEGTSARVWTTRSYIPGGASRRGMRGVTIEGIVPIVADKECAKHFKDYHSLIELTYVDEPAYYFIVMLPDLARFVRMWLYASIGHPAFNHHHQVIMRLQNPYSRVSPSSIPLDLQRELALPLGDIKGLGGLDMDGFDDTVREELDARMRVPIENPYQLVVDKNALMREIADDGMSVIAEWGSEEDGANNRE